MGRPYLRSGKGIQGQSRKLSFREFWLTLTGWLTINLAITRCQYSYSDLEFATPNLRVLFPEHKHRNVAITAAGCCGAHRQTIVEFPAAVRSNRRSNIICDRWQQHVAVTTGWDLDARGAQNG